MSQSLSCYLSCEPACDINHKRNSGCRYFSAVLWISSHPQGITAIKLVPDYTAW